MLCHIHNNHLEKYKTKSWGWARGKGQGPGLRSSTFSVLTGSIDKGVRQETRSKTKETTAIQASIILNHKRYMILCNRAMMHMNTAPVTEQSNRYYNNGSSSSHRVMMANEL